MSDQGGEGDSYSLLPPRQQWTDSGERASMLGVGTEGMGTLDDGHEPYSKQLNQGKRKRKDSWVSSGVDGTSVELAGSWVIGKVNGTAVKLADIWKGCDCDGS